MDDSQLHEKLTELKERIEKDKTIKARAEGELEALKKGMKEKFGTSSIKEAEEKLEELRKKIGVRKTSVTERFSKVTAKLDQTNGLR